MTTSDELFSGLVQEYRVLLDEPGRLRFAPTTLTVRADRSYLKRIIQNFLSNAIKYGEQGDILLGARNRGQSVEICVLDQGPGIAEEDQHRVFEDFYRAARHRKFEGVGLGLAVTSRLSQMMGSEISLRSEQGRGSCFSVQSVPPA